MLLKLLRRHLEPYRKEILLVVVFQLIQTLATLYLPTIFADIIDKGVVVGDTGYVMKAGGQMLAITLLQIAAQIIAVYYGARVAMAVGRDVRAAIFAGVATFSAREVGQFGAPSLITRTTNDVQQVQMLVLLTFTLMVSAPIMCFGGILLALNQDVPLSGLILVIVPILILLISLIVRAMRPLFRTMQVRIDKVNRVMREQITGIRVVRAFVREPYEARRFGVANDELTATALRAGRLLILIFPIVMLVFNASSVAVLWFGAARIDADQIQIGALIAFLQYLIQILMAVMMATFMVMMVPRAAVSSDRIGEVLATESSVEPPATPATDVTAHGEVELRDVDFAYPGAEVPVLRGVTLRARPGQTTAVIGSTGAGKTTLLSLIPRLFDATGGAVLVDGVDVRDLDFDTLRERIAIVPQRPYLFTGTVASNLRYGDPDATDEELWRCLEIAQARDFVAEMPEGLDAPVAQGGTNLSGGQRQRLAIARALVRRPEIYLFDDSFSALDLGTDSRLRAALRPVTADAAVIIVAQRVSTIVDADQIVVLEDGEVVGIGRHDELLETSPTYAEIVASQLPVGAAA